MSMKQMLLLPAALLACCALAACTQAPAAPSDDPSSAPVTPVASVPQEQEQEPEKTEDEKEDTVMDQLYVADAARYRGTVTSIDTGSDGEVTYCLAAFPGSGLAEQLTAVFTDSSRTSFELSSVREGDHLEVFYHPAGEADGELPGQKVIAANKLLPADMVYYNGILVERQEREDGSVDLVMVPLDTPAENRQDPMVQFVFHTGTDTQFRLSQEALTEGVELNIYHKGISTRSIPPQGVALEVRPLQ